MKRFSNSIKLALVCGAMSLTGLALSCSAADGDSTTNQESVAKATSQLTFQQFSKEVVAGQLQTPEGTIIFKSQVDQNIKSIQFLVDGRQIGKIDYKIDSKQFALFAHPTAKDKELFVKLVEELKKLDEQKIQETFGQDPANTSIVLLFDMATQFTTAPVYDEPINKFKTLRISPVEGTITTKSYGDEDVVYLNQCKRQTSESSKYATAEWTDSSGNHSVTAYCGSQNGSPCLGRCGPGCPCYSWYCTKRYSTKDCLDHDVCLGNNPGDNKFNPFAGNCGDEWQNAVDDFTVWGPSGW